MMRPMLSALLAFALPTVSFAANPSPVQVMIVGGFHMANPGHDLHNVQVDDVLSPRRQAEIAAVEGGLARFRPSVVAAEWPAETVAERYPQYLAGSLPPSRNEVVQLAFRLAKVSGARMIGVDVDGDFPYEPVQTYAKAHDQGALLDTANADIQAQVDELSRLLSTGGVSAALRYLNDPARVKRGNDFYRNALKIGGGTEQPGATLLTGWYGRNLRICANLLQAAKPGDRVVVFYGSGHAFLLRQCVEETPGYVLVEPNAYLPRPNR